jgi:hypothetical protein
VVTPWVALAASRGHEQRAVVVGVHVDEPGCDDLACDIDLARPLRPGDGANGSDPVAGNGDVGAPARPAAAIDHLAAPQNPIGHLSSF